MFLFIFVIIITQEPCSSVIFCQHMMFLEDYNYMTEVDRGEGRANETSPRAQAVTSTLQRASFARTIL